MKSKAEKGFFKKTLDNDLKEGIADTFDIMLGNHQLLEKYSGARVYDANKHYGVVDVLFFPSLSKAMMDYGFPTKHSDFSAYKWVKDKDKASFFRFCMGLMGFLLQFPRLALALLFTVLVLPLVLMVHILKYPFSCDTNELDWQGCDYKCN